VTADAQLGFELYGCQPEAFTNTIVHCIEFSKKPGAENNLSIE